MGSGKLFLVGEAPGKREDELGRPFVGKAGILLRKTLDEVGAKDVYITNAVKCRPPNNRTPTRSEIETCKPYLIREISCLRPKVIVALGKTASYALLGVDRSLKEMRGRRFQAEYGGVKVDVIVTYHPAAVVRNPKYLLPFKFDIRRAWEEVKGLG